MTNTSPRRRKFFDVVPSTNGCDETFDIRSRVTGHTVAWAGFWEQRAQCRRVTRALAAALNAAFASNRIDFDIASLAQEQREIAIVWSVYDVQDVRPDLSDDQAWLVLLKCERTLDRRNGMTLQMVEQIASDLFPIAIQGVGV